MIAPIRIDAFPKTPWKNGKGVTRELSQGPEGASIETFDWRVTLADIGPGSFSFSHFAGIDRTMVVTGAGMRIVQRDQAIASMRVIEPFSPLSMAGEDPLDAELDGVPIQAFNLMTRRGRARGTMVVHRHSGAIALDADIAVLFCALGEMMLELDGEPPMLLARGQVVDARPDAPSVLTCRSPDAILLVAMIEIGEARA